MTRFWKGLTWDHVAQETNADTRLLERQKAERLRKQLKKRLDKADAPEEKAKLEEEFHIADVDWHYAKYFPFMERYVGLYLTAKTAEKPEESAEESAEVPTAKRALHSERPSMWKEIEAAMEKGQRALGAIQERVPESAVAAPKSQPRSQEVSGKNVSGGKEKKEKHAKASKQASTKRKDIPAHDGSQPKQEREEQHKARDGEDGLGFFAF